MTVAVKCGLKYNAFVAAGVIGTAEASLHRHHPDLVLVDGDLPGNGSMELVRSIQLDRPATGCLVLANTVSQQAAALHAGAVRLPAVERPRDLALGSANIGAWRSRPYFRAWQYARISAQPGARRPKPSGTVAAKEDYR